MNIFPVCGTILRHYGTPHQLGKLAEECGELTAAAMKMQSFLNSDGGNTESRADRFIALTDALVSELADVMVLTTQMAIAFDADDSISKTITEKLKRQLERMNEE